MNNIHNPTKQYETEFDIMADRKLNPEERVDAIKRFFDANPTIDVSLYSVIRFDIDELKLLVD